MSHRKALVNTIAVMLQQICEALESIQLHIWLDCAVTLPYR